MKRNLTLCLSATLLFGCLLSPLFRSQEASQKTTSPPSKPVQEGLTHFEVFKSGREGYNNYRIPAVVVTRKGTLLAFCEARRRDSDTGDIDLILKRSSDGGRTWSKQIVIWDDGPNTCGNACPVVDRTTGIVWLLLTHNQGQDGEREIAQKRSKGTRTVWVCKSEDDGVTWSKPMDITKTSKKSDWGWYATGPGVGIQLQSGPQAGRLLIPCNHTVQPDEKNQSDRFEYGDHVIYSDDHGRSWELGGVVPALKIDEPQVAELDDGSIMMNMRSHFGKGLRAVSLSKDGGQSWGEIWHEKALIEPDCQASFLRYTRRPRNRKNRLLFSNPASNKKNDAGRVNMTVRLSYDEGKTWPVSKQIYSGPSAYSCLTVMPDMTLGCLYERGNKKLYEEITFARFSLEWLTDGTDPVGGPKQE